jgi:hypothetical protein
MALGSTLGPGKVTGLAGGFAFEGRMAALWAVESFAAESLAAAAQFVLRPKTKLPTHTMNLEGSRWAPISLWLAGNGKPKDRIKPTSETGQKNLEQNQKISRVGPTLFVLFLVVGVLGEVHFQIDFLPGSHLNYGIRGTELPMNEFNVGFTRRYG